MLNLPTPKLEAWKYTHLARAVASLPPEPSAPPTSEVLEAALPIFSAPQQVFHQGFLQPKLATPLPAGCTLEHIGAALTGHEDTALDALDTLESPHAWRLTIAATPPLPLVLIHTLGTTPLRLEVVVKGGAQATLLEAFVATANHHGWQHHAAHITLAEGATLTHSLLCLLPDTEQLIMTRRQQLHAAKGATYTGTLASFGGGLIRNELHTTLTTGCTYALTSLFCPRAQQHHDLTLHTRHVGENNSVTIRQRQLQQGASHAVFQGKFHVEQAAQRTNAYMHCHTLLLSDDARSSIKPELEIYADDVKCSHGAASGGLNPAQLFYLKARGLNETQARALLVKGFADEFVAAFPALVQPVVQSRLQAWLQDEAVSTPLPTVFTDDWLAHTKANPEAREVLREYGDTLERPHYNGKPS